MQPIAGSSDAIFTHNANRSPPETPDAEFGGGIRVAAAE
jgi:hypothetical protein